MAHRHHFIPSLGHHVVLVSREQLRFRCHGRRFAFPSHLRGMAPMPTPPASVNWNKQHTLQYPILGNDRYGDCYYAAPCHQAQTWTGNVGTEASFSAAAVVARYLQIAGGDNGLDDRTIFPEMDSGIVGPHGPHKWLDQMTVSPTDDAAINLALWRFGGLLYTAGLLDAWLSNPKPGDTWDAVGQADPQNGHAMHLSAYTASGFDDETWGFNPPIHLTRAGMRASDPELIVGVSLDWYNAQGYSPAGFHYTDDAALWVQMGGKPLPTSPFPAPGPAPVPPAPPGPTPPHPAPSPALQAILAAVDAEFAAMEKAAPSFKPLLVAVNGRIDAAIKAAFGQANHGGLNVSEWRAMTEAVWRVIRKVA